LYVLAKVAYGTPSLAFGFTMHPIHPRKLVAQACDACRRREIRCNGLQSCASCRSAMPELPCHFTVTPKRGGNRGARATVLNELRAGVVTSPGTSLYDFGASTLAPSTRSPTADTLGLNRSRLSFLALFQTFFRLGESSNICADPPLSVVAEGSSPDSISQGTSQSPGLTSAGVLEADAVDACIAAYIERIYPVVPFLTEEILRIEALHSVSSLLSRQFIVSFCAYVVTFGKVLDEAYTSASDLGTQLLNSALRIQVPERVSKPTRQSVFISLPGFCVCWFLFLVFLVFFARDLSCI